MQDIRIAMVQMTCRVAEVDGNLATMERFCEQAAAEEVDIICFPELGVCGYNAGDPSTPDPEPLDGDSVRNVEVLARKHELTVLAGLLERSASGIVYNTQVACGPDGRMGSYRKTHVPTPEIGTFCHGDELPVFDHPKVRFGMQICYDTHFPEVSTLLAQKGAEVIFCPHASPPMETAEQKRERWLHYIPARAYDNTVYVAICNQVGDNGAGRDFQGVTFVCNPLGEIVAEAVSSNEEEMVIADLSGDELLEHRRETTMFFRHFRRPELYDRWQEESR